MGRSGSKDRVATADLEFLKQNLWGDRLLSGYQNFSASTAISAASQERQEQQQPANSAVQDKSSNKY